MHTPPIMCRRSTTATRRPSFAAAMAAFWPPGPEPSTSRSKSYTVPSVPGSGAEQNPAVRAVARDAIGRRTGHLSSTANNAHSENAASTGEPGPGRGYRRDKATTRKAGGHVSVPTLIATLRSETASGVLTGHDEQVYQRLLKERIVFLGAEVDDAIANSVTAQLLLLNAEDAER